MSADFTALPFSPADILLPVNCEYAKWSVVACDQYTLGAPRRPCGSSCPRAVWRAPMWRPTSWT